MVQINVTGASALYMKVDITEVSQNVAGNSSTVKFVASMTQTSGDNWNQVPGVDFKVIVNGNTLRSETGFYLNVRGNIVQTFYTGNVVIPHNSDGTKSFSWSFWFDPKGMWHTYKPTTLSGTYTLPRIARVSNSTLSANTFDFGESFTVYTNQTDPSFTHTISYIRGTTVTSLATGVKTSKAVAIPTSQISNYTTATTASMTIRTSTYSGSTFIGNYDLDVTVKVPASAVPTIGAVSYTGSNAVFTGSTQFIASKDRLKATVANVKESYSSPIKTYLYRVRQRPTISMSGTANGATFPTFNFPATGSEVVSIQMAVVDARGRQSAWSTSPDIRVHAYQPPSIGATVITRNANVTTVNVRRNWSVTDLFENGNTSSARNTGALVIEYRVAGNSTWLATGGNANGRSGVNSNVALTPSFSGGTSYEFRIQLTDKFQTTEAPIIKIGTEFVPLDIGPKGIGVGKIHSDGAADLEVGSGGISSGGKILENGIAISEGRHLDSRTFTVGGSANSYYPVVISGQATFGFHRYSISRGYNWAAPDTWNTSTHRGGLTLDLEWSGDTGWGGNDKTVRVIEWNETYTTIVGGLQLARTGGLIVWLRGGGAQYRLRSERGQYAGVEVQLSGFTDGSGVSFPVRTSPVAGEINDKYPVRGNAALYDSGNRVWHTGNHGADSGLNADLLDGSHASAFAKLVDIPRVSYGRFTNTLRGALDLSSVRILHGIETATGNSTSTFNSLGNTLTFPSVFSTNTTYPITVTYSITSNVTAVENRMITVNIRNVSRTGFTWDARDSAQGTAPSGGTVYTLHWTAMGVRG